MLKNASACWDDVLIFQTRLDGKEIYFCNYKKKQSAVINNPPLSPILPQQTKSTTKNPHPKKQEGEKS